MRRSPIIKVELVNGACLCFLRGCTCITSCTHICFPPNACAAGMADCLHASRKNTASGRHALSLHTENGERQDHESCLPPGLGIFRREGWWVRAQGQAADALCRSLWWQQITNMIMTRGSCILISGKSRAGLAITSTTTSPTSMWRCVSAVLCFDRMRRPKERCTQNRDTHERPKSGPDSLEAPLDWRPIPWFQDYNRTSPLNQLPDLRWALHVPRQSMCLGRMNDRLTWGGGGGGGGGLYRPQNGCYGTMGFVGTRGAGDFVLGIQQGEIFSFDPMCLHSKYSEFCGEFKNG